MEWIVAYLNTFADCSVMFNEHPVFWPSLVLYIAKPHLHIMCCKEWIPLRLLVC